MANLQYFRSCRRAEKVWIQAAVPRTSRAGIFFGSAAPLFSEGESLLFRRWVQDGAVPLRWAWGRALKQRVS